MRAAAAGPGVMEREARGLVAVRLLGWGRPRPELAPGVEVEASSAMERSLAMRWVRALGVTSGFFFGFWVSWVVIEGAGWDGTGLGRESVVKGVYMIKGERMGGREMRFHLSRCSSERTW